MARQKGDPVFSGSFKDAVAHFSSISPGNVMARLDAEAARLGVAVETPKRYECEQCCDLGVIAYAINDHTDPRFGKFFLCPNPTCSARNANLQAKYQKLIEKSKIPTKYTGYTFETWRAAAKHRAAKDNWFFDFVCDWVSVPGHWLTMPGKWVGGGADITRNGLVFAGSYGTGKTGLMIAVAHALMAQGEQPLYIRAMDYFDLKYATYGNSATEADRDAVRLVQAAPILMLDDLNIQYATDNKVDVMEDLIRYRHGQELPTLITCNHSISQLTAQWGERSMSALMELCHWIPFTGDPLRDTRQLGGAR